MNKYIELDTAFISDKDSISDSESEEEYENEPKQFNVSKSQAYGEKCWVAHCKRIPDKVIVFEGKASYTCWCHNFCFE